MRKHPLADCDNCPLREDGKYVPSLIPSNPTLVVVGEAPGFQEAVIGEPFKGPSGKLLDQVLQHYGYKRQNVLYTNVVSCRPPSNSTPPKAATNACRGRLLAEVRSADADILALGGTAAASMVDDSRTITSLRVGPPKFATEALQRPSTRVVPTWHPAYCLRNADAFPTLVSDVGKLKVESNHDWTEPKWRYFDDVPSARAAIAELLQRSQRLVIDIEVGIEKDTDFGHPNEYDLLCVGLAYAPGKAVVLGTNALTNQEVLDDLRRLLNSVKIIAHHGKFDLAGLYPKLGPLELWFDTMLASYCLDERPGQHGLKVLAVERLGAPKYDAEILKYIPKGGNYANIPREILYKYNAMDVACTWALMEMFIPELEREDVRRVHDHMVSASNQLMYMEMNGITVDTTYLKQLETMFLDSLAVIEAEIDHTVREASEETITGLNPRSPMQIKRFLETCGITVASTNADTLERLSGRLAGGPIKSFLQILLKHRKESKLYGTYVKGIRQRLYRGRVHTVYMLHGTTSGRLASRNPNLQNISRNKDIRRQFSVSNPGNVFVHADFKQAEGRVIATLAQDVYLKSIFDNPDRDMFDELSNQLYGVGTWGKEERVRTKAFFYGLSFGREAFSIAMEYNMSVHDAERRLNAFMDLIPATAKWQLNTKRKVLNGEDLVTPFGRKRRFYLITAENKKEVLNEALSFIPQSTASDICLAALTRIRPMLKGIGWLRLTIHDALVAECPEQNQEQVADILRTVMLEEGKKFTDYVPFAVDITTGKNWGEL